jgi:hypothetical protein
LCYQELEKMQQEQLVQFELPKKAAMFLDDNLIRIKTKISVKDESICYLLNRTCLKSDRFKRKKKKTKLICGTIRQT